MLARVRTPSSWTNLRSPMDKGRARDLGERTLFTSQRERKREKERKRERERDKDRGRERVCVRKRVKKREREREREQETLPWR